MREHLPPDCLYGRLGGDTFGLCIPDADFDPDRARLLLSSFVVSNDILSHRMVIHQGVYRVTEPNLDVSVMFDRAHIAQATIKDDYKQHLAFYDDAMRDRMLWEQHITSELPNALERREICAYLQAMVDVRGREAEVGVEVRAYLDAIPELKGAELLFPGTETDTQQMFAEISRCRGDIAIFGGYPGGHKLNTQEHFIFDADGAMYDAMLVITYAGKDLHLDVDKSIGWNTLGMPFKVTKAEGKHLIELDGRPAAEVYEKFIQIDRKKHNNAEDAFEFPLLARDAGEDRLRSTVHIEEDGSVWLHGFVTEGMDIHLTYGDPTHIVETVNQRLDALRRFKPQAVLLYSCVVRKTFWEDFVDMEMEPFGRMCPTCGFHTWGEVMRNMKTGVLGENNITMLSIGMREGEPSAEDLPELRINDTVLQGQASVLKRLTRLVYATMDELQKAQGQLKYMAERDALTGIYNRGKTEALINEALEAPGRPVSLVMADIDYFKAVNDTYGHDVGDAVLRDIAALFTRAIEGREGALAGRWGGEEFFVVLPGMAEDEAMDFAERLRITVSAHDLAGAGHLTISQGVVTARGGEDRKWVYKQVDDALYRAKEMGRDRVVGA